MFGASVGKPLAPAQATNEIVAPAKPTQAAVTAPPPGALAAEDGTVFRTDTNDILYTG